MKHVHTHIPPRALWALMACENRRARTARRVLAQQSRTVYKKEEKEEEVEELH